MYLGKLSKREKKDETIWETILVCFENYVSLKSALEVGFLNNNNNNNNNNSNDKFIIVHINRKIH